MNLSIEVIAVLGCATGTLTSVAALVFDRIQENRSLIFGLANSREEPSGATAKTILSKADKDIEDLQYQIEQLENTLGDKVELERIKKAKSLLDQVLQNLHRIPGRALE